MTEVETLMGEDELSEEQEKWCGIGNSLGQRDYESEGYWYIGR